MKKPYRILIVVAAVAAVIFAVYRFFLPRVLISPAGKGAAASVIGGADGPTSIFIAGKVNPWEIFHDSIVVLIVGAALLAIVIMVGKRMKK